MRGDAVRAVASSLQPGVHTAQPSAQLQLPLQCPQPPRAAPLRCPLRCELLHLTLPPQVEGKDEGACKVESYTRCPNQTSPQRTPQSLTGQVRYRAGQRWSAAGASRTQLLPSICL